MVYTETSLSNFTPRLESTNKLNSVQQIGVTLSPMNRYLSLSSQIGYPDKQYSDSNYIYLGHGPWTSDIDYALLTIMFSP